MHLLSGLPLNGVTIYLAITFKLEGPSGWHADCQYTAEFSVHALSSCYGNNKQVASYSKCD